MAAVDELPASDEAGHSVRPYVLTGGRTRPTRRMALDSLMVATRTPPTGVLEPELRQAWALCRDEAQSVAEISAALHQSVQVTKVLLSDLIDAGVLKPTPKDPQDPKQLEQILAGLIKIPTN